MIAETITLSAGALIVYHHALYPMLLVALILLAWLALAQRRARLQPE